MMDSNRRFNSNPLSDFLLGQADTPLVEAEPISSTHNDVDLSLVKQELPDAIDSESELYDACVDTSAMSNDVAMATVYHQMGESTSMSTVGVKRPGRRGRKPILVATGKNGVKLEKRREQNRRAAATYRKKMNSKKATIEQDHARLEEEHERQKQEVEQLRKQKAELEAVLAAHKMADCKLVHNNNNNVISLPTDLSMFVSTNAFMNNDTFLNPSYSVSFENPLQQSAHRLQPTSDQSLAPSPYTPKTEQMFTFDNWSGEPKVNSPTVCRSFSPASSQLSASPAPDATGYCGHSMSLPVSLPSINTVYNHVQPTLNQQAMSYDPSYITAVDELLFENNVNTFDST